MSPAEANQPAITSSSKPSRMCASLERSSSRSCGGEIDHQERSSGGKHPRRFGNRRRRRVGIMEHLVNDDRVGALVGERKRIHVALPKARRNPRRLELHACEPKHVRRAVDPDRLARARPEQLDHPAGAGADIDQAAERPVAERVVDRPLDLAFGDVERADLVPDFGMAGEIAIGGLGALGADGLGARGVGSEQRLGCRVGPGVDEREHRLDPFGVGKRQENPAAFLAPLEHARVGEDLQMARDPRLALAEHLRELADGKLHQPQKHQDAQPRRIGERLESVGERKCCGHELRI